LIVVVLGVAGSGKSTLGQALAERLGWPFLDGDDFHWEENNRRMRSGVPLEDAQRLPWLEAMGASMAAYAAAGRPAVFACSALKRRYRALLGSYMPPERLCFVYLDVPRSILLERLAARTGHFFPAALLESQLRDLEVPSDDELPPTLHLDGTVSVEQLVAEVCAALDLQDGY
jgi:gluconokinase